MGRVVAPGEALWTDTDRDWALALVAEEQETCECGHLKAESTDPANEGAYVAQAVRCHACAARDAEARRFSDSNSPSLTDGLMFAVTKT